MRVRTGSAPTLLTPFAVADVQRALGAGDADVHEATFFLELDRIKRFAVRQHALLDADKEYMLELQTLEACSVDNCTASG